MPFVNLAVAQAAAAWLAAPTLVSLFVGDGPATAYIVAAVGAVIVLIGAYIGSRIAQAIAPPSMLSLIAAVSFAIIATAAALVLVTPDNSELSSFVFALAPVAGALAGYFLTVLRPPA